MPTLNEPLRGIPTDHRILSQREVLARVPLSRTTIWRMEKTGLFPSRIRLGAQKIGWIEADVVQWIAQQVQLTVVGGAK